MDSIDLSQLRVKSGRFEEGISGPAARVFGAPDAFHARYPILNKL